jgi:DNA-binding Xre family transcriptional regulator
MRLSIYLHASRVAKRGVKLKIHKAIKVILIEKDLSALDLAKILGINRSTIFRLVGEGSNPKVSTLKKVADALDVKVSYIILKAEEF